MKKIVIADGSGFIGKYLQEKFEELSYDVIIISRQSSFENWNNELEIINALNDSELLINLAGKTVNCRYNEKNKNEILSLRTETTKVLGDAIGKCANPPKLWINAGTATIYRHAEDRPMTEAKVKLVKGFQLT